MPWIFEPDDEELAYSEANKEPLPTDSRRGGSGAHPKYADAALEAAWGNLKQLTGDVDLPVRVEYSGTATRENPFTDHKVTVWISG